MLVNILMVQSNKLKVEKINTRNIVNTHLIEMSFDDNTIIH